MPIEEISPEDAHEVRKKDSAVPYLDVRSVPEFEQGHPQGAYNIPVMHMDLATHEMTPNPDFARVAETTFPKDGAVLLGCRSGQRSMHAAKVLKQLGYQTLYNVTGGFLGGQDEYGNVLQGWVDAGLPSSTAAKAGRDYQSLSGS